MFKLKAPPPLGEDLGELQGAVGDGGDEVEGRAAQVGAVDELVQALQQVVDHPRRVAGHQHVAPRADRHGYGRHGNNISTTVNTQNLPAGSPTPQPHYTHDCSELMNEC